MTNKNNKELEYSYNDLLKKIGKWLTDIEIKDDNINPNEKVYTELKLQQLYEFFTEYRLDNPLCNRISCHNANPRHSHQGEEEEGEEVIIQKLISLLDWQKECYLKNESDKNILSQLISQLEQPLNLETKLEFFSNFLENHRSLVRKSSFYEIETRLEKLVGKENHNEVRKSR